MSEHYFSEKPQSKSVPKRWDYTLRGNSYSFTSDIGVFSKGGIDFGTRLLLESFVEPTIAGDMLDLGCGYGPIGITLADCFKSRNVVMVDVNERAIVLAKENALSNDVGHVEVLQSDRLASVANRSFAAIVTNPPIRAGKKVVHKMFEESESALLSGGELWVVIQKKQGAPSAKKKLESIFSRVDITTRSKGYYILRAFKG